MNYSEDGSGRNFVNEFQNLIPGWDEIKRNTPYSLPNLARGNSTRDTTFGLWATGQQEKASFNAEPLKERSSCGSCSRTRSTPKMATSQTMENGWSSYGSEKLGFASKLKDGLCKFFPISLLCVSAEAAWWIVTKTIEKIFPDAGKFMTCIETIFVKILDLDWEWFKSEEATKDCKAAMWFLGIVVGITLFVVLVVGMYFGYQSAEVLKLIYDTIYGFIKSILEYLYYFAKLSWDFSYDVLSWINSKLVWLSEVTNSHRYLWMLNFYTALIWAAFELFLETMKVDVWWRTTVMSEIFDTLSKPIYWICELIREKAGLGLAWIFFIGTFPIQCVMFVLSCLIGGIAEGILSVFQNIKKNPSSSTTKSKTYTPSPSNSTD